MTVIGRRALNCLPMLAAAPSAAVLGIDALDVLVEVHGANGLPQWTTVGMKPPSLGALSTHPIFGLG